MNESAKRSGVWVSVGRQAGVIALSALALPAAAANYGWGGASSSDWGTTANWWAGSMALTGGTYDATLYITNRSNNRLVYSAANGYTIYTSGTRCLRLADGSNGQLAITGGSLETRGSGDFVGNTSGAGLLLVDGGAYTSTNAGPFLLGANNAQGTLIVSNGAARVGQLRLWCSVGTVNLVGGTLGVGDMSLQAGSGSLNLYGGTLQALANNTAWMLSTTNWICRLYGDVAFDSQAYAVSTASPFNGPGSITKTGSGALALNVSNTVGSITVNEGTLALGGSNTVSAGVTLNGGTLAVNHAAALGTNTLTLNSGRLDSSGAAAVVNALNNPIVINTNFLTFVGTRDLNLGAGAVTLYHNTVFSNAAKTLAFSGPVSDGSGTNALSTRGSGALALTGVLSVGGRVMAAGGSTLLLAGANTYTGATTVSGSLLVVAHNQALGTADAATSVSDNGSLLLTNGVTVTGETIYLAGNGDNNRGGLQAAANSTGTWSGVVLLNDANNWAPRIGNKPNGVLIVNGPIRSSFTAADSLFISGDPGNGRVVIASTNSTYAGSTGIIRGTLMLGADNALPPSTVLDLHPASSVPEWSKVDLAGFSQTVAGLKDAAGSMAARYVTNSSASVSVLTVNPSGAMTYYGRIDGAVSLVKGGAGVLTLAGTNNAYTGATVLNAGTLALGCDGALSASSAVTLAGGTLSIGTWVNAAQQLAVSGNAAIDLGDGTGRLAFADSSAQTWSGTLNLVGNFTMDAVRFGSSASALTQAQLGLLRVDGERRWLALNDGGYLYERKGTIISVW
jgi:autotransporter-associated beta strand protein